MIAALEGQKFKISSTIQQKINQVEFISNIQYFPSKAMQPAYHQDPIFLQP